MTVDYPLEECADFVELLRSRGIDPIFLLSPTTEPARVNTIVRQASGFVYYVSLKGVTGAQNLDVTDVGQRVAAIRSLTALPIGIGFGVRDAATATAIAEFADAVVVGSRLVQIIEQSAEAELAANAATFIQELRLAIDKLSK